MNAKNILNIAKIGIILSMLTPLVIGPFGLSYSSWPKAVYFRTIIEFTAVFYFILILFDKKYLPRRTAVLTSLLAYTAVLIITSLLGINFYRSLLGDPERAEGIVLTIHMLAFFIILCGIFKNRNDWMLLLRLAVGVSAISSLIGVMQKLKIVSLYGVGLPDRVSGTLSNPDFFAPYVLSAIFLSLFVAFLEKAKDIKYLWLSVAGLNALSLLLSGTRGAWVGFIAGFFIFAVFYIYLYIKSASNKKRKIVFFFLLGAALLLMVIQAFPEELHLRGNYYYETANSMLEFNLGSRIYVWKMAYDSWLERPLFGWGVESFSYIFDKKFKPEYLSHIPENMYFDHPHNKLLEILASSGIVGLVSYLLIFFFVFKEIYRKRHDWGRKDFLFPLLLFSFFIAYFFQNIFFFDTISNYQLFFFAMALVAYSNFKSDEKEIIENKQFSKPKIIASAVFAIFILFIFFKLNFQPAVSAYSFPGNAKYEDANPLMAVKGYSKSLEINSIYKKDFNLIVIERFIFILENGKAGSANDEIMSFFKSVKSDLENDSQIKDRRRNDTYEYAGRLNQWLYRQDNSCQKCLENAEIALKSGIDFNPQIQSFYHVYGECEIMRKNYKKGEDLIAKAYELSPKNKEDEAMFYKRIGVAYSKANNMNKASEYFLKSINITFEIYKNDPIKMSKRQAKTEQLSFIETVAVVFCRDIKNINKCIEIFDKAIEIFPAYKNDLIKDKELVLKKYK